MYYMCCLCSRYIPACVVLEKFKVELRRIRHEQQYNISRYKFFPIMFPVFTRMMDHETIFVQIASYRDTELIPTIQDLLEKADNPRRFTFGICWQYGPEENIDILDNCTANEYRIVKVPYKESQGLGWARCVCNTLLQNEEYTLQIDSHHRFKKGWDTMLMEDYKQALAMSPKPVITTYAPPFTPGEPLNECPPTLMSQYEFSNDKLLMSRPHYIMDHTSISKVIRARTISAHFLFASSSFIRDVPYDPDIYFGGYTEETTISARAFTHGYDFFSPYRLYIWHEYTRSYRPKHWDDHKTVSLDKDILSRNKTRQLFGQEDHGFNMGGYGLGNERTLHDYEVYGGFDFKKCLIQQYTLECKEPPNPVPWESQFIYKSWKVQVTLGADTLSKCFTKLGGERACDFIALGIHTSNNREIHRVDLTSSTHPKLFSLGDTTLVLDNIKSVDTPAKYVVYVHNTSGNWSDRIEGDVVILKQVQ